ncbi:hypothetical protein IV38_GL001815 [Lactobacillus selangorensis]|uniref:DUF3114 domain-containing protein n=1 Tax=Lactobacillus selangorensis TaxID=81857 RepID=A0A0R2FJK4_9LACO|nr:hypothetical protein IV38_GL001815 [Lactobacillus selangorensis]KRN30555.1 hypothetical protein IV40_GL001740 [Lactobacillus selangorensis]
MNVQTIMAQTNATLQDFLTPTSYQALAATKGHSYSAAQIKTDLTHFLADDKGTVRLQHQHNSKLTTTLTSQVKHLANKDGWDGAACAAYLNLLDTKKSTVKTAQQDFKAAHEIGSTVYSKMYHACQYEPRKKVLLLIEKQFGGKIDQYGMLQLTNQQFKFYPHLGPNSSFLAYFAQTVQKIYRRKDGTWTPLSMNVPGDQAIHEFRYWIDRQDLHYIHTYFKGKTNYAQMMDYQNRYVDNLYFGESSRLHNKFVLGQLPSKQVNDKILSNDMHGEFIFNMHTGKTVSEWNVLKVSQNGHHVNENPDIVNGLTQQQQLQLLDTESFNYASPLDEAAHYDLDVSPASASTPQKPKPDDEYLEDQLKVDLKNKFAVPDYDSYTEIYLGPQEVSQK